MSILKRGDPISDAVKALQARLNELGIPDYNGLALVVDGAFGSRTESAVKAAQEKWADPPGVYGPLTAILLDYADRFPQPAPPPAAGTLAQRIVAIAQEYHRANIVENPPNSNKGGPAPGQPAKYSVNAIQAPWFPSAGQPWCAMFAATVVQAAGYALPKGKYGWPAVAEWYRYAGDIGRRYNAAMFSPQPGDLFTIGTSSHIGIVESVSGGVVTTIEGNSRNRVASNTMQAVKPAYYIRLG